MQREDFTRELLLGSRMQRVGVQKVIPFVSLFVLVNAFQFILGAWTNNDRFSAYDSRD